ncbi:putative glucose-methanol-choline oxidoreductase [Talaromyces proteolyticus]|uniref:Glucose-methanol-choline oxidoreductase n=1 Tax=Talaromyces proteolyticus TaxID=1131652 RepID=A0AAD4KW15_9EURO|nr:putative glucose-methanol-choline oxidoreductase [Talaromyces proteolyticus]KAH8701035.1 putative glucose-methanol-choline oxidoreductase [Talaromyces proteolyticus]
MKKRSSLIRLLISVAATTVFASDTRNGGQNTDYVIVGGGPAGLVLAERLSRDGTSSIVLLEAGPRDFNATLLNTPALFPFIADPLWNFTGQPDENLAGNSVQIPQGRVAGGGTAVNGMAYCRGAASVYDEWASISGNEGLAWNSLLQDFLEVSHYAETASVSGDQKQIVNRTVYGRGKAGVEVSRSSIMVGYEELFSQTAQSELGLHEVDMNDGTGIGVDRGLLSIYARNHSRSYSGNVYRPSIEVRPNVHILYNAWVSHIGFDGNRAVNVTYHQQSGNREDSAVTLRGSEIILSAGAINSPKLLMLSGIGPRAELERHNIPVIADRPEIGSNLHDHALSVMLYNAAPELLTVWQWTENSTETVIAKEQYASNSSGPLGTGNGFVYATFRVPDSAFAGLDAIHYTTLPTDRPHVLIQVTSIPLLAGVNSSAVTAWASLVQPEGVGRVGLHSSDYRDNPVIETNFYGSDADKAAILWGYKKLREVMGHSALQTILPGEIYPGANVTTDEDVWKAIQAQTFSYRHPIGTVALGTALGSDWRLRGLEGIRVVDSSTFPFPTTCHPQSAVYALANRAAKDILKSDKGSRGTMRYVSNLFSWAGYN